MLIAVAGMVGAGKTTTANALSREMGIPVLHERVDPSENPFLEPYYAGGMESMQRYQLPLAMHYLVHRADDLYRAKRDGGNYITDQHLGIDMHVFIKAHLESGRVTQAEYRLIEKLYEQLTRIDLKKPDVLVYLTGPLETMIGRIATRGRAAESDVPIKHWAQLYRLNQEYIASYSESPLVTLDVAHYDVVKHPECVKHIAKLIRAQVEGPNKASQVA